MVDPVAEGQVDVRPENVPVVGDPVGDGQVPNEENARRYPRRDHNKPKHLDVYETDDVKATVHYCYTTVFYLNNEAKRSSKVKPHRYKRQFYKVQRPKPYV